MVKRVLRRHYLRKRKRPNSARRGRRSTLETSPAWNNILIPANSTAWFVFTSNIRLFYIRRLRPNKRIIV